MSTSGVVMVLQLRYSHVLAITMKGHRFPGPLAGFLAPGCAEFQNQRRGYVAADNLDLGRHDPVATFTTFVSPRLPPFPRSQPEGNPSPAISDEPPVPCRHEGSYSNSINGSLAPTESMGWTWMVLIIPPRAARMLCSIFIASTTQSSSPAET